MGIDAARRQIQAERAVGIDACPAIRRVEHIRADRAAEQAGGVQDTQGSALVAGVGGLACQPFGGFGLHAARRSIVEHAPPGIAGPRVRPCGKDAGQWGQIRFDLPVGWRARRAGGRAEAVEVLLQLTGGPQLVEGGVEIAGEQGSAAGLSMATDCLDQVLGQDALGFGVALAPRSGAEGDRGMRHRWRDRQHAHRGAGCVVQVGAQAAGAQRARAAVAACGGRAALATQHRHPVCSVSTERRGSLVGDCRKFRVLPGEVSS